MPVIESKEHFKQYVDAIENSEGYVRPLAFGIGIARLNKKGDVIDTYFPCPNYESSYGTAAVLSRIMGRTKTDMPYYTPSYKQLQDAFDCFRPFQDEDGHPNVAVLEKVITSRPFGYKVVVVFIDDNESGPKSVPDVYLRLHLLSHRLVTPRGINLDGMFGILPNIAWTDNGPIELPDLPLNRFESLLDATSLVVHSVDKIPRMVDYVVPSGVRIADASRVRLGAYLGEGTTVMHEGFVNFNAGCEGPNMIEGRISAGVWVGAHTDLGGGASIMGTLSGGGKEVVTIGDRCLIGANAGTGISLGDNCIIEAGCYVTAAMKLQYLAPGASHTETVKALELSGMSRLLFRRNSETGVMEAIPNKNAVELNEALHKN